MYMFELDKFHRIAKEMESVFEEGGDSLVASCQVRQDVQMLEFFRCSNDFLSNWHSNKAGTPSFSIELAVLAVACPGQFEDVNCFADFFHRSIRRLLFDQFFVVIFVLEKTLRICAVYSPLFFCVQRCLLFSSSNCTIPLMLGQG